MHVCACKAVSAGRRLLPDVPDAAGGMDKADIALIFLATAADSKHLLLVTSGKNIAPILTALHA